MKIKISKLIILVSVGIMGIVGLLTMPKVQASVLSDVEINEQYMLNETLTIPAATLTVDGNTENANHIIIFPSGKAYDKSYVTLNELGKYVIEYSAYINNKKYSNTVEFLVINSRFSFDYSDTATAVRYNDYQLNEYDGTTSSLDGLLVDLPKDAVFKYNKIIDLTEMGKKDNLVTFSILPHVIGTEDFQYLYFRLTDINDPSNYVTISFHDSKPPEGELDYGVINSENEDLWNSHAYTFTNSYVKAGAEFQSMVGYEHAINKIHVNDDYGYNTLTSFHGTPAINKTTGLATNIIAGSETSVNFDYAERTIYVEDSKELDFVVDLDSKTYNYRLWDGFSDGKAYLSMWADDYTSKNSAKIFIYDIAGDKFDEAKLYDTDAPVINIDYLGLNKNSLPKGIVGHPYPLYGATAKDAVDGNREVTSLVYYNYNSHNRSLCNVSDGKFIPRRSGMYTVVNRTKDKSGNTSEEIYSIDVVNEEYQVNISVLNNLENCNIGQEISLGELQVDLPQGFYTYETIVKSNSVDYKVEDATFMPKQKGNHTVLYNVTDFLGRKFEYSYEFECLTTGDAVIFDDAVFNKYLISGNTYEIPKLDGYDFSSDNNGKLVELENYLIDSNGTNKVSSTFVPVVNTSGEPIVLQYVYNNVVIKSYSIPCFITKNENGIDMSKYFATVEGNVSVNAIPTGVTLNTTIDKTKVEFINYLTAEQFKFEFSVNTEKNKFSNFIIYLKDSYDESNQIKINYKKSGDASTVRVNDYKDTYSLKSSFVDNSQKFVLVYDSIANCILTNDDLSVSIALDGFTGFDSKKILVSMEFVGVKDESEVILYNIDGQPLNNQSIDAITPKLVFEGEYKKRYSINTEFQLYKAYSSDVLSPSIQFTLTVKAPTGNIVNSKDGIKLENVIPDDYIISLDQYGKFALVYKVTDGSGRTRQYIINLDVSDEIKPELTLSSEKEINVKLGQTVVIPTATATDNLDTELSIFVYLENPNGETTALKGTYNDNNSFKPTLRGTYRIKYLVSDSTGNFTVKYITVNVK